MSGATAVQLRVTSADDGIIHSVTEIGHRRSYVDTLASMLGYTPMIAPLKAATIKALLRTDSLVLATFDDAPASYAIIAFFRGLVGRKTAALFLRPQTCLRTNHSKFRLKKSLYRIIRRLPNLTLVTITPHTWQPSFHEVSHVGTYDPQYWDFHDGTALRTPCETSFARELANAAGNRAIICLPGFLSREKGFGFLAEVAARPEIAQAPVLLVAAGAVLPEMRSAAEGFTRAGGYLVDRELSGAEIESIYGVSDAIWACYHPQYDQASGIFGRAVQTGTPVFIRRGSLIQAAAVDLVADAIALPYGDAPGAAAEIHRWAVGSEAVKRSAAASKADAEKVAALREHFRRTVLTALQRNV